MKKNPIKVKENQKVKIKRNLRQIHTHLRAIYIYKM
jgi:hypothetical protein